VVPSLGHQPRLFNECRCEAGVRQAAAKGISESVVANGAARAA
jgi:hypothetical protein